MIKNKKIGMKNKAILVSIHFPSNVGYAIAPLEKTFYKMARQLTSDEANIHYSYTSLEDGAPKSLPSGFTNVITFDHYAKDKTEKNAISNYIKKNNIDVVFGFDLPVSRPSYYGLRKAGVRKIISYYGSPMSSINHGFRLLLKRLEVKTHIFRPDHFIFESEAMRKTAVYGRGIPLGETSVIHLGVDVDKYNPRVGDSFYAHKIFGIPNDRKIIFYSGHMEERKGVHVIVRAAVELINKRKRTDVHFLILGNKSGEEKKFLPLYEGTGAASYITFGGYRNDLEKIMPTCYLGTIASNGWDSFPRSALEMAACGLPLIVSNFQGLVETIEQGDTGVLFKTGDHIDLAMKIEQLLDDEEKHCDMSRAARERIEKRFTLDCQLKQLVETVQEIIAD